MRLLLPLIIRGVDFEPCHHQGPRFGLATDLNGLADGSSFRRLMQDWRLAGGLFAIRANFSRGYLHREVAGDLRTVGG